MEINGQLIYDAGGQPIALEGMCRDTTERRLAEQEIQRQAARAEVLARTAARLNAQLDLDTVLQRVCDETARALQVPLVCLTLYDDQEQMLRFAALNTDAPPQLLASLRPIPLAHFAEVMGNDRSFLLVPDLQQSALHMEQEAPFIAQYNARTLVICRMQRDGQLIGTLDVLTFNTVRAFTDDEMALLRGLAELAAQAITNARLYEETNRRLGFLEALRDLERIVTGSLDLEITLNNMLNIVTRFLQVDAADVLLLQSDQPYLEFVAGQGFRSKALQHTCLRLGDGYAGKAALQRQKIIITTLQDHEYGFVASPHLATEEFVSYCAIPLLAKGQMKGVLELFHRSPLKVHAEWESFLEALAGQAAMAIDNVILFEAQQQAHLDLMLAYDTTLEGWSRALDLRDRETEGHSARVTDLTERLARALGVPQSDIVHYRRGTLLHDIGKMGIPDAILLKSGPLTEEEWAIMRRHPGYAFEWLSPITYLRPALDIPYCHHERWNGTGYPRGLKGNDIPLAARIFAVVERLGRPLLRPPVPPCLDRNARTRLPAGDVRHAIRPNGCCCLPAVAGRRIDWRWMKHIKPGASAKAISCCSPASAGA